MSESYVSIHEPSGEASWMAHYRLPEQQPREQVLSAIHMGVHAMLYMPNLTIEEAAGHGLAGVLIGPEGDTVANMVRDVIFTTDPSRRHGERDQAKSDWHAYRMAEIHNWEEVENPEEIAADERDLLAGSIGVIMGLNKAQYYGKSGAFTLQEARDMLPTDTLFTETTGGFLFSSQPGWEKPYGEPAIVLRSIVDDYSPEIEERLLRESDDLAKALNDQDRHVPITPRGTFVRKLQSQGPTS